jgi:hypothetical protein
VSRSTAYGEAAHGRHADEIAALLQAVLTSPGATDPVLRGAAYRGDAVPGLLADYLAKVRTQSYRVTDDDVNRMLTAGYSEDAVFELTIATALGAAHRQLEAGLRALQGN